MSLAKSVASFIKARPKMYAIARPFADRYLDLAGYRKLGLVYDDLIAEENEVVQKALKRLPPRLVYDRIFRQRRAMQCSLSHIVLPKDEWTKPEENKQDIQYLRPYVEEIERETAERVEMDSLTRR